MNMTDELPLFPPDPIISTSGVPDLGAVDYLVINTSAGKDSQTAMRRVIAEAEAQGFPRRRIVALHQILEDAEWQDTDALAREQAGHYGIRFETARYRDKDGEEITLLEYVRRRRKWPSPAVRFCTSEFKRAPGNRFMTQLSRTIPNRRANIVQVFGFRREESASRRKKVPLIENARATSARKRVIDWHPILDLSTDEVWRDIRESEVRHHWAYDEGLPRLSCAFCIYAPRPALVRAAQLQPELFEKYRTTENEVGHQFRQEFTLDEIAAEAEAGAVAVIPDDYRNL